MADIKKVSIGGTQYDIRDANAIEKGYAVNDFATNCITEIPQDIKLELNNGTLTLKSGSILTAPNGIQKQTTVDRTFNQTGSSTHQGLVFCTSVGVIQDVKAFSKISSGSSLPANPNSYDVFYNTADNKIYLYYSGTWNAWGVVLPIAICTVTNGVITSIDKVFNGAGYVGHHAFVLPGVKGLIPNGFNADGTLKSTNRTLNSLVIKEMGNNVTNYCICGIQYINGHRQYFEVDDISEVDLTKTYSFWYIRNENKTGYVSSGSFTYSSECVVIIYSTSGTTVTKFEVRPVSGLSHNYIQNALTGVSGYASNKTQTLKNVNGTLTFVDG